jgi:hypothetical protein
VAVKYCLRSSLSFIITVEFDVITRDIIAAKNAGADGTFSCTISLYRTSFLLSTISLCFLGQVS